MRRKSLLQKKILVRLADTSEPTIACLAKSIGAFRPSVSRSLKALFSLGLICRDEGRKIELTDKGRIEAGDTFTTATNIVWLYGGGEVVFLCPCGDEVSMSQEIDEDTKRCDCGREYRYKFTIESTLPKRESLEDYEKTI